MFSEDFSAFINDGTPGYVLALIAAVNVPALFNQPSKDDFSVSAQSSELVCDSTLVASAVRGTAVTVKGVNYKVKDINPDGTGITLIELEKV